MIQLRLLARYAKIKKNFCYKKFRTIIFWQCVWKIEKTEDKIQKREEIAENCKILTHQNDMIKMCIRIETLSLPMIENLKMLKIDGVEQKIHQVLFGHLIYKQIVQHFVKLEKPEKPECRIFF